MNLDHIKNKYLKYFFNWLKYKEHLELSYIVGRNVKLDNQFGKYLCNFL